MKKFPVTIIYNQPGDATSSAWGKESDDDTLDCVKEIQEVLEQGGYRVQALPITRNDMSGIKKIRAGLIINFVEWTGMDMKFTKKAMDLMVKTGLPFTGSDFPGLFLSTDKVLMKTEFDRLGIPSPKYQFFKSYSDLPRKDFAYPVIVKPAYEHCGIGISQDSVVENERDLTAKALEYLTKFNQPILAEEYIDGRELAVTILEDKLRPLVLPIVEIFFQGTGAKRPMYTYETKWNDAKDEFKGVRVRPAEISDSVRRRINSIARKAYLNMGGRDYPRLDIRLRGEEIFVLEINNNPDMDFTFQGSLRVSVESVGMNFLTFLEHVMNNVIYRFAASGVRPQRLKI